VLVHQPHHDGSPSYVDDQAPRLGDTVGVRVFVPHRSDGVPAPQSVHVRAVLDGEPRFVAAEVEQTDGAGTWWRAQVRADNPVTRYRFLLQDGEHGLAWLNGTGVHHRDVTDAADFRLAAGPTPPDWVADQVVYQIFPDRFARAAASTAGSPDWVAGLPPWAIPAGWDDDVAHRGPATSRQVFGGDLDGVTENLGHLQQLGATMLYLTPFFEARSNHRYDAVTFDRVDPLLGGDGAFDRLLHAAHSRGLRVVGDLTTNHTGVEHPWFRAGQQDAASAEAGYYRFEQHPDRYASWLGVLSLPRLDHADPGLRRLLYDGPDSVVARWLARGMDGWRIDVANMTGRMGEADLNALVAASVQQTARRARPDAWVLAEHGHDASLDLTGDGWHGVMDYGGFTRPVWTWLGADPARSGGHELAHDLGYLGVPTVVPVLPGQAAATTMREFHASMPWQSWSLSTSHLDSHDTPRFRTVTGGGSHGGIDHEGHGRGKHLVGLAMQMTMPGVPTVFMGDELGLTAVDGEHARTPFPWRQQWDDETVAAYRTWIGLRRGCIALRRGGLRWLHVGRDSMTYLREHPDEQVLVHVARAVHDPVRLPLAPLGLTDVRQLVPLVGEPVRTHHASGAQPGAAAVLPSSGPAAHAYHLDR
jgi:alpha-glucosidase